MKVDNNSANTTTNTADLASAGTDIASVGANASDAAGMASLFGAVGGLVATGINMGTQSSSQAFATAQQNYQVTEQQNAEFLKLIAG